MIVICFQEAPNNIRVTIGCVGRDRTDNYTIQIIYPVHGPTLTQSLLLSQHERCNTLSVSFTNGAGSSEPVIILLG